MKMGEGDSEVPLNKTYTSESFIRLIDAGFTHRGGKDRVLCFFEELFHFACDAMAESASIDYDRNPFLGRRN